MKDAWECPACKTKCNISDDNCAKCGCYPAKPESYRADIYGSVNLNGKRTN